MTQQGPVGSMILGAAEATVCSWTPHSQSYSDLLEILTFTGADYTLTGSRSLAKSS